MDQCLILHLFHFLNTLHHYYKTEVGQSVKLCGTKLGRLLLFYDYLSPVCHNLYRYAEEANFGSQTWGSNICETGAVGHWTKYSAVVELAKHLSTSIIARHNNKASRLYNFLTHWKQTWIWTKYHSRSIFHRNSLNGGMGQTTGINVSRYDLVVYPEWAIQSRPRPLTRSHWPLSSSPSTDLLLIWEKKD